MLLFKGRQPIQLAHLLTKPARSIINQHFDSRIPLDRRRYINGDGFGVGWYEAHPDSESAVTPCIFTSVTPAWNNMNLIRLADKIKSPLVFAHVRPSTAGSVSESNCHPWQYGRLMFMHHGMISDFHLIKRKVQESLSDDLYLSVNGNTDSEWAFAVFLSHLESPRQAEPFSHSELQEAMLKTIQKLNSWCREARSANKSNDNYNHDDRADETIAEASTLNFAVSDGDSIVCTRYVNSRTLEPVGLYFSSGTKFECDGPGHYRMVKGSARREDIVVIASEPLTFEETEWRMIPRNSMAVITARMNVLIFPIIDENSQLNTPNTARDKVAEENEVAEDIDATVDLTRISRQEAGEEEEEMEDSKRLPEAIFINAGKRYHGPLRPRVSSNDGGQFEGASMTPSMYSYPSSSFLSSSPSSASSLSTELSHLSEDIMFLRGESGKSDDLRHDGLRGSSKVEQFQTNDCDDDGDDSDSEIEEDYRIFPVSSTLSAARALASKRNVLSNASLRQGGKNFF